MTPEDWLAYWTDNRPEAFQNPVCDDAERFVREYIALRGALRTQKEPGNSVNGGSLMSNPSLTERLPKRMSKSFIVYDERGIYDPDEAAVLVSCRSLKEAWSYLRRDFGNGCIYEYDVTPEQELVNECLVGWRADGEEWRA